MTIVTNCRIGGRRRWSWIVPVACLLLVFIFLTPADAQTTGPTPSLDQINAVARELYCPLCNGVRLDTCELQACVQMRQVIADKLTAGVSKEQIKQEFVAQYGAVVLGEPPRKGLNWLVWLLPAVVVIAGAVWIWRILHGWTRAAAATQPAGPAPAASPQPAAPADDYLARVDADLKALDREETV